MALDNEYTGKVEKEQEAEKKKSSPRKSTTAKKKKGAKKASPSTLNFLRDRINKKKLKSSIGIGLLLAALFIFLANFSYLLTWKVDQNRVMDKGFFEFLFEASDVPVANWLGKFGAWISHLFIYRWFGIASFGIPLLLLFVGVKALFNKAIVPLRKATSAIVLFTVWFSLFFGFFSNQVNYLGGTFGYQVNDWFTLTLGRFGSLILIVGIGYIFGLIIFNLSLKNIISWFQAKDDDEEEEVTEEDNSEVLTEDDLKVVNTLKNEDKVTDDEANVVTFGEDEEKEVEKLASLVVDEMNTNNTEEDEELIESEDEDFSINVAPAVDEEILTEEDVNSKRDEFGEYDPKLDLSSYTLPPIDLLKDFGTKGFNVDKAELESNKNKIVKTLQNYKIEIAKIMATVGPTVTLYEIVPAPGVRISKIKNLEDDIALSLAALGIRIIAPIPGKGTIGIEVPNSKPEMVSMRSLIASKKFQESDYELPVVMGKTITNETYTFDLTRMPHLLVAGATGQGKSVGLNAILISILYKKHPSQVKFVLIDPKKVELTLYNKIERHFLAKLPEDGDAIITDTSKVVNTLNSLCMEMDERYELLKEAQVRTIKEYNAKFIARRLNPENGHRYMPYIVVLIDEFADLIMTAGKEVEHPIARLAQLARAIGIHLIVATQRPSVNVITGMIKANFPARIAFRVLSKIDSRTILDGSGADQLIGRGDMLISNGQELVRLQCGFVDTPEVEDICSFIGDQRGYSDAFLLPEYVGEASEGSGAMDDEDLDSLFADAARIVVLHQQGSASLLQRKLKLGYNRAGRIVDQLESMGIIGQFRGSKAREVLYADEVSLNELLESKGIR
ncbi:MAG: S-DNA-T family DNA segregation ATPase FtsK/SpoIIIE [Crocinitomicaceae bacterium]|jgi:S-DNA-T family DNA segregation ATPase FtsK/SpoIIIE